MTISKIIFSLAIYSTICASCHASLSSENKVDKAVILRELSSRWGKQRIDFALEHYSDIELANTRPTGNTILSRQLFGGFTDLLFSLLKSLLKKQIIFPGTKWCGDGNIAENDNDFGVFEGTDRCCRAHDNCKPFISSEETDYELTNNGFLIRKECECDKKFSSCLSKEGSIVSTAVGITFFNVLQMKCFTTNETCYADSTSDGTATTESSNTKYRLCDPQPFQANIPILNLIWYLTQLTKNGK